MTPEVGTLKRPTTGTGGHTREVIDTAVTGRTTTHLQGLEGPQVPPEEKEKGSQIQGEGGGQSQEIMKKIGMMTEAKAETGGGAMEQPESSTMGGQEDPEATAGRPNV